MKQKNKITVAAAAAACKIIVINFWANVVLYVWDMVGSH